MANDKGTIDPYSKGKKLKNPEPNNGFSEEVEKKLDKKSKASEESTEKVVEEQEARREK